LSHSRLAIYFQNVNLVTIHDDELVDVIATF
jgi:hypothetical protein